MNNKKEIHYPSELNHKDYNTLMGWVVDYRMEKGLAILTEEMVDFAAFCILKSQEEKKESP